MLFFFFFFFACDERARLGFRRCIIRETCNALSPRRFLSRDDGIEKRGQDRDPVEAFSINDKPTDASRRVINRVISHDDVEQVDSFHERRVSAVLFIFRRCWGI